MRCKTVLFLLVVPVLGMSCGKKEDASPAKDRATAPAPPTPAVGCDDMAGTWTAADLQVEITPNGSSFAIKIKQQSQQSNVAIRCEGGGLDTGDGWLRMKDGVLHLNDVKLSKAR